MYSYHFIVLAGLMLAACGPQKSAEHAQLGSLPVYDAAAQAEFDDSFDPAIVGLSLDKPVYRGDVRLRARSQAADFIVRAKLTTIAEERYETRREFHLVFRTLERIGGPKRPTDTIDVVVPEGSPSFGMIANAQSRLRGKTAIVLTRAFRGTDGPVFHSVVIADDPEALAAVQENIALQELH